MGETSSAVRVRYVETDQMGVAHHSAYLSWMEIARTEYMRKRGLPYRDLEENGYRMPVMALSIKYILPARYDDELVLNARLAQSNGVRFNFEYEILRSVDGQVLATGISEHVSTDFSGKPRRLPGELFAMIGDGSENS